MLILPGDDGVVVVWVRLATHTAPANYGQKRAARAHLVAGKERIAAAAAAVAVTRQLEAEEEEEAKGSSVMQTD